MIQLIKRCLTLMLDVIGITIVVLLTMPLHVKVVRLFKDTVKTGDQTGERSPYVKIIQILKDELEKEDNDFQKN